MVLCRKLLSALVQDLNRWSLSFYLLLLLNLRFQIPNLRIGLPSAGLRAAAVDRICRSGDP